MEHTPGTWVVDDVWILAIGPNGFVIRTIAEVHPIAEVHLDANFDADARLIAAAPELLAVLRQILLKQQTGEGDFSVARLCLAAIAKAEGRSE